MIVPSIVSRFTMPIVCRAGSICSHALKGRFESGPRSAHHQPVIESAPAAQSLRRACTPPVCLAVDHYCIAAHVLAFDIYDASTCARAFVMQGSRARDSMMRLPAPCRAGCRSAWLNTDSAAALRCRAGRARIILGCADQQLVENPALRWEAAHSSPCRPSERRHRQDHGTRAEVLLAPGIALDDGHAAHCSARAVTVQAATIRHGSSPPRAIVTRSERNPQLQ